MLHNHATSQRFYITTGKLRLDKLSHGSTHASGIRLLPPSGVASTSTELRASKVEPWGASTSAPKLLQMLLAA
jgi:hypothetical protein